MPLPDGPGGTGVDPQLPAHLGGVGQPQQPAGSSPPGGLEQGAHLLPLQGRQELVGVGQHHRNPTRGRDPGGLHLGAHPAGPDTGTHPGGVGHQLREVTDPGYQPGPGFSRVCGVEAVHVAQDHQRIGPHQVGGQRRQAVVVAEPDLPGRDGVVLVDHGNRPQPEQPRNRVQGVPVAAPVLQVTGGQQHLRHHLVVGRESLRVTPDQDALADRGRRLLSLEILGSRREPQRSQRRRDGPGGHQHQPFVARL